MSEGRGRGRKAARGGEDAGWCLMQDAHARCSGVLSSTSTASTLAPFSRQSLTASTLPWLAASANGVQPASLRSSISTSRARQRCAAAACPWMHATCRGEFPSESHVWATVSLRSTSIVSTWRASAAAACGLARRTEAWVGRAQNSPRGCPPLQRRERHRRHSPGLASNSPSPGGLPCAPSRSRQERAAARPPMSAPLLRPPSAPSHPHRQVSRPARPSRRGS